jgi:hypothetical protein
VKGINIDNIEELYNPSITGEADLISQRAKLIRQGMHAPTADRLALEYIFKNS